jgi:hypothetical protein
MKSTARLSTTKPEAAARLLELIQMRLVSQAIQVVAALGIADLLANRPKSIDELAEATKASTDNLRRVMRALMSFDVFSQNTDGRFALAPLGEFLRRDSPGSLHGAALLFGGEFGTNAVQFLLHSVKTGETAIQKRADGKPIFEWLQSNPEQAKLFDAVMTAFATLHLTGVLEAYDFSKIKKLVDVGGGHGKNISEILKRNPGMRGVLFDLPHTLEGGKKTVAQFGVADRCDLISGDFFSSVPAGADGYLVSRVIHDWDDEKAVKILQNIRGAIAPNGRLLLLETMLRSAGTQRTVYPVLSDLNMLLLTGGRERTEAEYRALYQVAGFELTRTVATTSPTGTTVIEGRPAA